MNLTPYQEAQAVYLREESTTTFFAELALHLENPTGYVLKSPTMFCLARPVASGGLESEILNARIVYPRESWDAWFLAVYAGDVTEILRQVPLRLPLYGWQKRNRLRFWTAEDIDRLFLRQRHDLPHTSLPSSEHLT